MIQQKTASLFGLQYPFLFIKFIIISDFVMWTWSHIVPFWDIFLEQEVISPYQDGKGATVNVQNFLRLRKIPIILFQKMIKETWKVRLLLKASPHMMFQLWPNVWSNFSWIKMHIAFRSVRTVRSDKELPSTFLIMI